MMQRASRRAFIARRSNHVMADSKIRYGPIWVEVPTPCGRPTHPGGGHPPPPGAPAGLVWVTPVRLDPRRLSSQNSAADALRLCSRAFRCLSPIANNSMSLLQLQRSARFKLAPTGSSPYARPLPARATWMAGMVCPIRRSSLRGHDGPRMPRGAHLSGVRCHRGVRRESGPRRISTGWNAPARRPLH